MTEKITIAEYKAMIGAKKKKHPCRLHTHGSKWEKDYCLKLQLMQKMGEIQSFRWQPSIDIGDGKKWCIDFEVLENSGRTVYHEAKGFNPYSDQNALFRLKMSLQHFPNRVIYWNWKIVPPLDSAGRLKLREFHRRLSQRKEWAKKIKEKIRKNSFTLSGKAR
jgi:hypothetical protein